MPELELRLFGHGVVLHGGEVVPLATRKALGVLAFLSLNGRSSRQHLAGLFWADMPESAARNNLRKELFRLRETALESVLEVSSDAVFLRLESDAVQFCAWQPKTMKPRSNYTKPNFCKVIMLQARNMNSGCCSNASNCTVLWCV
jgi:DNA-binding SARP family transcriptional activator